MIDDTILRLAAEGLRLFPVIARDKKPLVKDWPNLATTNEEQLLCLGAYYCGASPFRERAPRTGFGNHEPSPTDFLP
jgi:Bifunctional DNA primase/polymerase, N-terminal